MNNRLEENSMQADEDFKLPCSVNLFLPAHYEKMLLELAGSGEDRLPRGLVIEDALWRMRASEMTKEERKAEWIAEIQKGLDSLDSGEGVEATPEFWEEFERRCLARYEWLKTQKLGNTLLADELYQYVQDKISSGQYANPTEVVCAALDRLEEIQKQ
jgi:Arc/MetJ-type ribon-helix-helix transcriptional regulator